jgi:hypothetical protein
MLSKSLLEWPAETLTLSNSGKELASAATKTWQPTGLASVVADRAGHYRGTVAPSGWTALGYVFVLNKYSQAGQIVIQGFR